MAERLSINRDDYEQSIARIFDLDGYAIGTGFLVAPGYVLTCAHVVLQAIGIEKAKFADYKDQPDQAITLDFPVIANGVKIKAEVVAWSPYSVSQGDMAGLKLLSPEPEGGKSIPISQVTLSEIENEEHSVYGFGNSNGGRSDAYKPKTNVAGGRFQFCKAGDPDDETIKPGYSGAPVWNEARGCVIGMVATAVVVKDAEQKSTAYAIPKKELQSILRYISAFSLHDVLMRGMEECGSDDERHRIKIAIDTVLQFCNPDGEDQLWQTQLKDLSIDRASKEGWEVEGVLVWFAMMLALKKATQEIPQQFYDTISLWVQQQGFEFPMLLDRAMREPNQKQVPSSNQCHHLMVAIEQPEDGSTETLRVSIWPIADRETYDPKKPPKPLVLDETLSLEELPAFIRTQIRKKLRKKPVPTIHLFVPRKLFGHGVEMWPISQNGPVLGGEYPFVVRTNLNTHPIGYFYYDDWNEKWEQLEQAGEGKTSEVFECVDCSLPDWELIEVITPINAAVLHDCASVTELFDLIAEETALPVALWSREPQFKNELTNVLDCVVKKMPERIRQERATVKKSEENALLGRCLSLVWEDPKIVPPDMQFDPEAC